MPLSDREQQILSQIESQLASEDPKFARAVGTAPRTSGQVRLRYGVVGFLVGMLMLLGIFQTLAWGFLGVVVMFISAVTVLNQMKHLGEDRSLDLGGQLKGGFSRYMEGRDQRSDEES